MENPIENPYINLLFDRRRRTQDCHVVFAVLKREEFLTTNIILCNITITITLLLHLYNTFFLKHFLNF